jgi:hypothetical protein
MTETLQNFSKSWLILKQQLGNDQRSTNLSWPSTIDDDLVFASLTQHPTSGGNDESLNRVVKLLTISGTLLFCYVGLHLHIRLINEIIYFFKSYFYNIINRQSLHYFNNFNGRSSKETRLKILFFV